jgi:hypothetical protein
MKSARPHDFADLQDVLRLSRVCHQIHAEDAAYNAFAKSSFAVCNNRAFEVWLRDRPIRYRQAIASFVWVCLGTAFCFRPRDWDIAPSAQALLDFAEPPYHMLPGLKHVEIFGRLKLMQSDQLMLASDRSIHNEIQDWIESLLACVAFPNLDIKMSHRYHILTTTDKRHWYELV